MTTAFLVCSLFLFLGIGMPIAIALGLSSTLAIIFFTPDSLASVALRFFGTMEHYTLLAMPFFMLLMAAPEKSLQADRVPREVTIVLDRSGSMSASGPLPLRAARLSSPA